MCRRCLAPSGVGARSACLLERFLTQDITSSFLAITLRVLRFSAALFISSCFFFFASTQHGKIVVLIDGRQAKRDLMNSWDSYISEQLGFCWMLWGREKKGTGRTKHFKLKLVVEDYARCVLCGNDWNCLLIFFIFLLFLVLAKLIIYFQVFDPNKTTKFILLLKLPPMSNKSSSVTL